MRDGKPDYKALAESYKQAEQAQFRRRDDLKAELKREDEAARLAGRPAAPGDYTLPDIKAPDGTVLQVDKADPIFGFFQAEAHRYGLTQEQFESGVERYIQTEANRGPNWAEEKKLLGENADLRQSRVATWAKQTFDDELFGFFSNLPASANMVKMFERLMEQTGNPAFRPADDGQGNYQGSITLAELRQMQSQPGYYKGTDPALIEKVRAGFKALNGRRS